MNDPVLEHIMDYHADLKPPAQIGAGPFGQRAIYDVTGGTFEGPKLRGKILPSGGDWILIDGNGRGQLDVRATFETDDGALVYVQYFGILVMNDKVAAGQTDYGDAYFMTQPRFETGDERYAWLNNILAVAQGRVLPGAVEYRVFALRNP